VAVVAVMAVIAVKSQRDFSILDPLMISYSNDSNNSHGQNTPVSVAVIAVKLL
jgi:hypothetical protein